MLVQSQVFLSKALASRNSPPVAVEGHREKVGGTERKNSFDVEDRVLQFQDGYYCDCVCHPRMTVRSSGCIDVCLALLGVEPIPYDFLQI